MSKRKAFLATFASTFALVFLAELGDRTQIVSFSNAANSGALLSVILGSSLALTATSLLAVLIGNRLTGILRPSVLRILSGVMFLLTGVWILVKAAAVF